MICFTLAVPLVLLAGWLIIVAAGFWQGYRYAELEAGIIEGISSGMPALLILIAAGALTGAWIAGGIIPGIVFYGLQLIHPDIFLPVCFLLCCATSLATGTSWGTAGTVGVAMMATGSIAGMPLPLVAGAVLSGAYFGDKLSPVSDSVILTATLSRISINEHIRGMLPVSLTAFLISTTAFGISGIHYAGRYVPELAGTALMTLQKQFSPDLTVFIPVLVTLFLLYRRKPALPVIYLGAGLGALRACIYGRLSPVAAFGSLYEHATVHTGDVLLDSLLNHGGIHDMLTAVLTAIAGLGIGGLLKKTGILASFTAALAKGLTGVAKLTGVTIFLAFMANAFGGSMYVPLILVPGAMGDVYDRAGLHRKMLSRNTEFGGTLTAPLIPWSDNGVFMSTVLGVSVIDYLPFMWLTFACIATAFVFAATGLFTYRAPGGQAIPGS